MARPWRDLTKIDQALHAPARIAILLFLLPRSKAKFSTIQNTLDLSPGNLSSHLKKLESSGYVDIEKLFVDNKPTTIIYLTTTGFKAVSEYAKLLSSALE